MFYSLKYKHYILNGNVVFREAVIIEKPISTISVIFSTGATFGLKENLLPSYSTLENSFI